MIWRTYGSMPASGSGDTVWPEAVLPWDFYCESEQRLCPQWSRVAYRSCSEFLLPAHWEPRALLTGLNRAQRPEHGAGGRQNRVGGKALPVLQTLLKQSLRVPQEAAPPAAEPRKVRGSDPATGSSLWGSGFTQGVWGDPDWSQSKLVWGTAGLLLCYGIFTHLCCCEARTQEFDSHVL